MRSLLALTALAASSSAFVLPRQPLRALTPRAAMPTEIASAFDELLDQCLIDDGAPACQAFMTAMTTLRELHDKSPGNA
ncbi:hypothetical protein JL722_9447 [Aureococcus anophagefferens]|nr:hypothetical protein JL722_9447 [Aureococcus anophagefferens]